MVNEGAIKSKQSRKERTVDDGSYDLHTPVAEWAALKPWLPFFL